MSAVDEVLPMTAIAARLCSRLAEFGGVAHRV